MTTSPEGSRIQAKKDTSARLLELDRKGCFLPLLVFVVVLSAGALILLFFSGAEVPTGVVLLFLFFLACFSVACFYEFRGSRSGAIRTLALVIMFWGLLELGGVCVVGSQSVRMV